MRARRAIAVIGAISLSIASLGGVSAGMTAVDDDIDGDGHGDILVGVPQESISGRSEAGMVNMIPGSANGATGTGSIGFSQAGAVAGALESGDMFGGAVELADINGDGFADAIVGSPGEAISDSLSAGMITYIPGSASGLDLASSVGYIQGGALPGGAEFGDFFGWDLAEGDFDNDGYADIAVASPFEDIGSIVDAGGVTVLFGSPSGIDAPRSQFFSQSGAIIGGPEQSDFFGQTVASGDLDGDGFDDLIVGVPGEDVGSIVDAGAVHVIYGSASGLVTSGNQYFSQSGAVLGGPEDSDLFGFAVGASDLDCDGADDLIVGVPNEDLSGEANAGVVHVLFGASGGVVTTGNVVLRQGADGVVGDLANNLTGKVLAGGDFDGDSCGDFVFGSPVQDIGSAIGAGTVTVVYGDPSFPSGLVSAQFSQSGAVPGTPETNDIFGSSLGVVDVHGDGYDDVVVGVPGEAIGSASGAGMINILPGSASGLTSSGSQGMSQNSAGVPGTSEAGDFFSGALDDGAF